MILFTHWFNGLEFTFEKRPCRKTVYGYRTGACDAPQFKGATNRDHGRSQIVTLCNHLIPTFNIQDWEKRLEVIRQTEGINEDAERERKRDSLAADSQTRSGDRVWETFHDDAPWLNKDPALRFNVLVKGLTRDEAIRLYAMADAIKGERDG